jgi:predicted CoA-binding protein
MSINNLKKEMLNNKKWALVGVTKDENKFGYKIFKSLKEKGYKVYGINPKYDEIEGEKIYNSLKELPEKVDCVNVVVNSKIALKLIDDIVDVGINNVWFQPGTYDKDVIEKSLKHQLNVVRGCLYVELGNM